MPYGLDYKQYQRELAELPGVQLITYDETEKCNYQYIVLEIDDTVTSVSRNQFADILWAENVIARRYFYPGCHRMEPYRSFFPHSGLLLPETEKLTERILSLPTGTAIGSDEISQICQIIRLVVAHSEEVSKRFQSTVSRQDVFSDAPTLNATKA